MKRERAALAIFVKTETDKINLLLMASIPAIIYISRLFDFNNMDNDNAVIKGLL